MGSPNRSAPAPQWWFVAAMCLGWLSVASAQQLLDRVVARVGGVAITQTDVEAAIGLGIIDVPAGADRIAAGTKQLVDRQLLLTEVARFPPPEPPAPAIDNLVAKTKAHAGAGYQALVQRTGVDDQRVRELARDTLRIEAYVEQRFGTTAQVGQQEARDYYDTHQKEFTRNGVVLPFEQVENEARTAAATARRRALMAQWVADLRTRGEVVELTSRP